MIFSYRLKLIYATLSTHGKFPIFDIKYGIIAFAFIGLYFIQLNIIKATSEKQEEI